ncbi:hypothetical protein N7450_011393 [Penicillium hetheringtonii]|uniref:Uncharacterized protein n=1 Tax=Penicillium hetheringtonii TaxID=911720 RepID=A0AAD6DBK4_9EURO|nr:hypothetical protein N7450_011393 [Penicillium hetheringtonii]
MPKVLVLLYLTAYYRNSKVPASTCRLPARDFRSKLEKEKSNNPERTSVPDSQTDYPAAADNVGILGRKKAQVEEYVASH